MRYAITALIALLAGFGGAALYSMLGLGHAETRQYLVANPDILPEMSRNLRAMQGRERVAELGDVVTQPFPGAVIGNPNGSKTLVKFTDYACGFCRASVADINRLVAEDPELRVVIREWPIFEGSEAAARMGLAAAAQGKYDAFYHAMFAARSKGEEAIEVAARTAGLDMDAARAFAASQDASAEIANNLALAQRLQLTGTPAFIANGELLEGAVGYEALSEALATPADS